MVLSEEILDARLSAGRSAEGTGGRGGLELEEGALRCVLHDVSPPRQDDNEPEH